MPKNVVFIIALAVILVTGYSTLVFNSGLPKETSKSEIDTAINQANHLFRQEVEKGRDFSDGPCLSNALLPNWVVDIVHNPRQQVDDLTENQCPAYSQGRSKHIVELDTQGNLIKAE